MKKRLVIIKLTIIEFEPLKHRTSKCFKSETLTTFHPFRVSYLKSVDELCASTVTSLKICGNYHIDKLSFLWNCKDVLCSKIHISGQIEGEIQNDCLYLHARQAKISVDCIDIYNDARIRKHKEEDETKRRKLNLGRAMTQIEDGWKKDKTTNKLTKKRKQRSSQIRKIWTWALFLKKMRFGGSDSTTKV